MAAPVLTVWWDYCGTSIEMIERHYGRYVHGDEGHFALLATLAWPCPRPRKQPIPAPKVQPLATADA